MDGSPEFASLLDALDRDAQRLRGPPEDVADALERGVDPQAEEPAAREVEAPYEEAAPVVPGRNPSLSLGATSLGPTPVTIPERAARRGVTDIDTILDWVIGSGGTGFLHRAGEPAVDLLLAQGNAERVRARFERVVYAEVALTNGLVGSVPASPPAELALAALLTVLQLREIAQAEEHLETLLKRHLAVAALDAVSRRYRLRGLNEELRLRVRSVRRGRNALSALITALVANTRHVAWTHQLWAGRQLTALQERKAGWQTRQRAMILASGDAPTEAELAAARRLAEIARQLAQLAVEITPLEEERTRAQAALGDAALDRAQRAEQQRLLADLWPFLLDKRRDRRELNQEKGDLRRRFPRAALLRAQAYLEAAERGLTSAQETQHRDQLLARADNTLAGVTDERLATGTDQERWDSYRLLLERLLGSNRNVGVELLMDSFLNVAHHTERRRDVGVEHHAEGAVEWLTYPGHPDGAVDLNASAGSLVTVSAPSVLWVPPRLRVALEDGDRAFRLTATVASARVHGTSDVQDVFGHIAGALVPSRSGRGASSDDLAEIYRRHDGEEIAPAVIRGRTFGHREVVSILIGLLADRLTSVQNARHFEALRREIVDDLEALVVRERGLPPGTRVFVRGVSAARGRGGLNRLVQVLDSREVVESTQRVLSSTSSRGYGIERRGLINRLWQFTIELRAAGAEPHRRAGSATIAHTYRAAGGPDLGAEVFYTHLHEVRVRPNSALRTGTTIGRVGMTGNAVNPHVHVEIQLSTADRVLGPALPHEFFPLRTAPP